MPDRINEWAPLSPDLNPIEMCWSWMKDKLKFIDKKATNTKNKLQDVLNVLWLDTMYYD